LNRELRTNKDQIANSAYARNFQEKSSTDPTVFFGRPDDGAELIGWVADPAARQRYVEAFERSDFESMLNTTSATYPRGSGDEAAVPPEPPR
jgi:hypothetical protein